MYTFYSKINKILPAVGWVDYKSTLLESVGWGDYKSTLLVCSVGWLPILSSRVRRVGWLHSPVSLEQWWTSWFLYRPNILPQDIFLSTPPPSGHRSQKTAPVLLLLCGSRSDNNQMTVAG